MQNPHITPQQRRQIVRLQADGHSKTAIAERLGIDRHTVARHAQQPTAPAPELTPEDLAKLRFLLDLLTEREACPDCGAEIFYQQSDAEATCARCRGVFPIVGADVGVPAP